jgi:tetratricopeptide (TPR) repeat protein
VILNKKKQLQTMPNIGNTTSKETKEAMKKAGVLEIDVVQKQVIFCGRTLAISARFIDFLVLLSQNPQNSTGDVAYNKVGVEEVSRLAGFRSAPPKNLGTQLRTFVKRLEAQQAPIVVCEKSKLFYLNRIVETVQIVPTQTQVEILPHLYDRTETEQLAQLALAEALIEAGEFATASQQLQTLMKNISSNLLVRAKLLLAETWLLRGAAQETNQNFEDAESALHINPHPLSQSLCKIFAVRLKLQGDTDQHHHAEQLARGLLGQASPTTKARLENLLGLLVLEKAEPIKAEHHFQAALHFASEAHWWWGVLAAMSNLGLMALRQARYVPQLCKIWLTRADEWLTKAVDFAKQTGLRYNNTERLIYAAQVKNCLGQPHMALCLLESAESLVQDQPFHQAWRLYELAETHRLLDLGDAQLVYQQADAILLRPQELHFLQQLRQERR